jgi:ATP-dependent protease HslVU (ClpYQ) peptidase subunit
METEQDVIIGADSFWGHSSMYQKIIRRKVFHVSGAGRSALFGTTGSVRAQQLLKFGLVLPEHDIEDGTGNEEFLVTKFVDAVRDALREGGALKEEDGIETVRDWSGFLLAYRDRLYGAASDLQITRVAEGYQARGAGEKYALGALAAMRDTDMPSIDQVVQALRAAAAHSPLVHPPYYMRKLSDLDYELKVDS